MILKPIVHCLGFLSLIASSVATAQIKNPALDKTQDSFESYINQYLTPELFSHNEWALEARLKLLDQIPPGGTAKVMTFHYDNGEATRLLAAHMCLAAKRGVNVQFTADSKTGDRAGVADAFDSKDSYKVNEEVFQVLANCGVQVRIHNHISEFDVLNTKSMAIPKISRDYFAQFVGSINSTAGNAIALYGLKNDFVKLLETHFTETVGDTRLEGLKELRSALLSLLKNSIISFLRADSEEERYTSLLTSLEELKVLALTSKAFQELDREKAKIVINGFVAKLQEHPRLGAFYRGARLFNRLNHRKLFWVSSGGKTCMFVGGRNLGDHYLTWGRHFDEFMDGDVLLCNHHEGSGTEQALTTAEGSFNQVWNNEDAEDPLNIPLEVKAIEPNYSYQYDFVLFPDKNVQGWGSPMWIYAPYVDGEWILPYGWWGRSPDRHYTDLTKADRTLPAPTLWNSSIAIHDRELREAYDWKFHVTTWMREKDQVRKELFAAIDRETEYAYIETAYSELSLAFREKIKNALERGVRVDLITNSIFVSDGGSKAIRLIMARWTRATLEKYPELFHVKFATVGHGHMIHFKGASFKCQKDGDQVYRLGLIGSHNFHARSGYSDKEHALSWKQLPKSECAEKHAFPQVSEAKDLEELRSEFYAELTAQAKTAPLKTYYTFEEELQDGIASGKISEARQEISKWAIRVLYEHDLNEKGEYLLRRDSKGCAVLRKETQLVGFLEMLSESGLSDLFGTLL